MKRVISIILTLSMLLSLVVVVPALNVSAAEEYEHTLSGYNVGTLAYKFDGTVYWEAFSGLGNRNTTPYYWVKDHYVNPVEPIVVASGTSGDVLRLDGVISDGEWGSPSVSISSKDAVVYENGKGTDYNYVTPNAENSFFTYINNTDGLAVKEGTLDNDEYTLYYEGLKYDVYFMWDNNYLYLAARVYDPDGHSQKVVPGADDEGGNNSLADTWNGDAFQFRIDGEGPNSVVDGGKYDAAAKAPATFDIPEGGLAQGTKLEAGQYSGDNDPMTGIAYDDGYTYPWASSAKQFRNEVTTQVCNFTIGYSTVKNGFTAIHDSAKRYNPHTVQHLDGDIVLMEYVAYDGASLSFYNTSAYKSPTWTLMNSKMEQVYATVTPQGEGYLYTPGNGQTAGRGTKVYDHDTTDYEVAIPWSYINLQQDAEIAPGLELGVALGLINAKSGGGYNSTLEWGNGIFNGRMSNMPQTCGGSNSLILSETSYKDHVACEHTFADPTCEPYTCTKCGYQKGYKSGHKYNTFEELLPTGNEAGYTKAQCKVCGDVVTRELASSYRSVHTSFSRTETTHNNIYDNWSVGYSSLWIQRIYELDDEGKVVAKQTTNAQGEAVDAGTLIRTVEDNKIKTSFWAAGAKKPYCSMTKDDSDLITNPFGFAVLDCTSIDQTGTYFYQSTGSPSYTYKTDIYLEGIYDCDWPEGVETVNNVNYGSSGYLDQMFFWFGGANEIDYQAGLYKIKGEWYFAIIKSSSKTDRDYINKDLLADGVPSGKDGLAEFERQAIVFNKATDEQVKFGAWHEMVFFYDKDAGVASLYWDDELVAGAYNERFPSAKSGNDGNSMFRPFNIQFYMTDIEIGASSLASKYVSGTGSVTPPVEPPVAEKYSVTVAGEYIGDYYEGDIVFVSADVREGYIFDYWYGNIEIPYPYDSDFEFVMPAHDVTLDYSLIEYVPKYCVYINDMFLGEFEAGETITVAADVPDNYVFDAWEGNIYNFSDPYSPITSFVMPDYNVYIYYYYHMEIPFIRGDVNEDGNVNLIDIYTLKDNLLNKSPVNNANDVYSDGKLNLRDMFELKKILR